MIQIIHLMKLKTLNISLIKILRLKKESKMKSLELLMPAGSPQKLNLALDFGADAVYLGPPIFSLRARENDFSIEQIKQSIEYVHSRNKKLYMTLNIFARNRKIKPFTEALKSYEQFNPDAIIVSDPGLAIMCKEIAPHIPLHLSVQANCMNWKSAKFWKESLGVERIILSRELSIVEISEIKQKVPELELEAFVHGSICMAYSGRCLLSSYMSHRDANQGVCDNSCREKYKLVSEQEHFLEDQRTPGTLYPIEEDEHGTYILNAKDLCMIDHLKALKDAGVESFKVEGRTKSEFYAAMVARSYRGALDDLQNDRAYNPYWRAELDKLSNRGFHTAFMIREPKSDGQNYSSSQVPSSVSKFVGLVKNKGYNTVEVKNKISLGQSVEIISPLKESITSTLTQITDLKGRLKTETHSGSGLHILKFENDIHLPENSLLVSYV